MSEKNMEVKNEVIIKKTSFHDEEYDFSYEFERYAESIQRPLKTYRVEFNLGSNAPTGDGQVSQNEHEIYTTTYSTSQYSTSKITSSNFIQQTTTNSRETTPSKQLPSNNKYGSLKRIQNDSGEQLLNTPGILDPQSGRVLTVGEAIHLRLLDIRTGEIIINGKKMTIHEAIKLRAIDPTLAAKLLQQKDVMDAENGYETAEKRIKVEQIISSSRLESGSESPKSIADAITDGDVDTQTGLYRFKTGQTISIAEAYERGYLIRHESVAIKSNALCLSDAISHGLVATNGWIADRNSGDTFRLDSAIANQLVDPNVREIVDTKNDVKVTLNEALKLGVLNPKTGRYVNQTTKEKLTFIEAKNRLLIVKPFTLKDVVDLNLLDNNGLITSPMRRTKLTIMQAIEAGVLDDNNFKCITKQAGELVTLDAAIADGIILPAEVRYKDLKTGEIITIPEAVDRGLISSVSQKSLFEIDGFRDPHSGEFVSFNSAISKDILRKKNGEFCIDSGKGNWVGLQKALDDGLVRPEVYDMFQRKIGVYDSKGVELSVLELVLNDLIDPKSGYLIDPSTGTQIPLNTAIEKKLITPEGALLLSSLLSITLTTETVTKTIKRYVTVTSSDAPQYVSSKTLTFTQAVKQGFIDEDRQLFKDPKTGETFSVQQALSYGLLAPDNDENSPVPMTKPTKKSTLTIITKQIVPQTDTINMKSQTVIEKNIDVPIPQKTERDSVERELYELPPEGWLVSQAIEQNLFDPHTGLFIVPGTDRLVSFEECINLQILNSKSVSVLDPKNGRKMSVARSFEKKVLDSTGHYGDWTMAQAITNGKIILENPPAVDSTNQKVMKVTKVSGQPHIIEVSGRLDSSTPQFTEVTTTTKEILSPEPLQIAPGAIYDPSTALVIFTETGKSENVLTAVAEGLIDPSLVKITQPKTGRIFTISEAIDTGILDPKTGMIDGNIDLITAANLGILSVIGAPLIAAEGALRTVKFVTDPQTGQEIPIELAYERGLVSRDQLSLNSSKASTPSQRSPERERIRRIITSQQPSIDEEHSNFSKSPSPERESKIVILQKIRKKIVKPKDAVELGIIDKPTCEILEDKKNFVTPSGDVVSISEALEQDLFDGSKGYIVNPQNGDVLCIQEAVEKNVVDPASTNHLLVPLAQSLSIPKLREQGLIDPETVQIFHPETGTPLTIREAIISEILDPRSKLLKPKVCTVEEAISDKILDENSSLVQGKINLLEAVDKYMFDLKDPKKPLQDVPPVGMTFPVAVKKGIVDIKTKSITHPITTEQIPLQKAIDENFIMSIPYPPNADAIKVMDAIDKNLIDTQTGSMKHPKTNEPLSLKDAVESGILIIKPLPKFVVSHSSGPITSITETSTSVHTVTTKTIELVKGYAMVSSSEIQNLQTGEIISVEDAKEQGILINESETKNTTATKEIKQDFSEAVKQGLVDVAQGTYDDPNSGRKIPIQEAVNSGILEISTVDAGKQPTSVTSTSNLTITEAFETIYDEKSKQFRDPKDPSRLVNLEEAIKEQIIDPNEIIYDTTSGKVQTLQDGIKEGIIDPQTGTLKPKSGSPIDIKKAAKMGLLAVVGAPVLAGMAVANAVKNVVKKDDKPTPPPRAQKPTSRESSPEKTVKVTQKVIETIEQDKPYQVIETVTKRTEVTINPDEEFEFVNVPEKPQTPTTVDSTEPIVTFPSKVDTFIEKEIQSHPVDVVDDKPLSNIAKGVEAFIESEKEISQVPKPQKQTPVEVELVETPESTTTITSSQEVTQTGSLTTTVTTVTKTSEISKTFPIEETATTTVVESSDFIPVSSEKSVVTSVTEPTEICPVKTEQTTVTTVTETGPISTEKTTVTTVTESSEICPVITEQTTVTTITESSKVSPDTSEHADVTTVKEVSEPTTVTSEGSVTTITSTTTTITKTSGEPVTIVEETVSVLKSPEEKDTSKEQHPEDSLLTGPSKEDKPSIIQSTEDFLNQEKIKDHILDPQQGHPVVGEPVDDSQVEVFAPSSPKDSIDESKVDAVQKPKIDDSQVEVFSKEPIVVKTPTEEQVEVFSKEPTSEQLDLLTEQPVVDKVTDVKIIEDNSLEVKETFPQEPIVEDLPATEVSTVKTVSEEVTSSGTLTTTTVTTTTITSTEKEISKPSGDEDTPSEKEILKDISTTEKEIPKVEDTPSSKVTTVTTTTSTEEEVPKHSEVEEISSSKTITTTTVTTTTSTEEVVPKTSETTTVITTTSTEEVVPKPSKTTAVTTTSTEEEVSKPSEATTVITTTSTEDVPKISETVTTIPSTEKDVPKAEDVPSSVTTTTITTTLTENESPKPSEIDETTSSETITTTTITKTTTSTEEEVDKPSEITKTTSIEKEVPKPSESEEIPSSETVTTTTVTTTVTSTEEPKVPEVETTPSSEAIKPLEEDVSPKDSENEKVPTSGTLTITRTTITTEEITSKPKQEEPITTITDKLIQSESQPSEIHKHPVELHKHPVETITTVTERLIQSESQPSDTLANIKDAAKTGLLAVVGAPVLAGMALTDAIKSVVSKPSESKPEIPQNLPIGDAISQNIIDPKSCKVVIDGEEQPQNVQELLDENQLSPLDEVKVIEDNLVALQKPSYLIGADETLSMDNLTNMGLYDPENGYFTDPVTGLKVSFQTLVFETNVFDSNTILVKNFSKGVYETLDVALERPLLDKHTGHMVDPRTGKKVPFFECIERNWIIRGVPKSDKLDSIEDVINPDTGFVKTEDGDEVRISDAINSGDIDIQSISVRDPVSGEVIPLRMAIELGVVDLRRGILLDIQTNREIPMEDAYKLGFLVPGSRKPISLEAAVKKGLYDPESGKLFDSESQNQVDVQKSIEIGLVDPKISLIVDTANKRSLSLDDAIEDNIVVKETGRIKDTQGNELLPFDVSIERQILHTDHVVWSLIEILQREYYDPQKGLFLNPATGEEQTLQNAIKSGFIEVDTCLVNDEEKGILVPAKAAIESGLIDPVKSTLQKPQLTMDQAFVKGYLVSTKSPLSLVDCLLRGLYDPVAGTFTIDGENLSLKDALLKGKIIPSEMIIFDPKSESIISLAEAIKLGYVDPIAGLVIDPYTGGKLNFIEALENRILIPNKRKRSLPDAVYGGLYDPKTGQFSNTITREKLSTESAIRRGILDPESTVVSQEGKIVPFKLAIESGVVDGKEGRVTDVDGQPIDFREALDKGILVELKKPLSLSEAVVKNVYTENDGLFTDPKTGLKLSFAKVLEDKLIDSESVQIRDFKTGLYKDINLEQATRSGVIDPKTARVTYNSQTVTLKHAFDVGILVDSKAPISLQRAIHQGLYNEKSGKITDTKTGRQITLLEAIRKFIVNHQLPCYFDEHNEKMLTLTETCSAGLIDRREGVFREPGSDVFIPLSEAMTLGLIVDIESAGFGLYECLAMGFYDLKTKKIIHPVTERTLTLREACVEDIVSLSSSLVKNNKTGKYIRLGNAIQEKIIDDLEGTYILDEKTRLDLQEARHRGYIVSNRKLLTLETVIRMHLYKQETAKFIDPTSSEYLNLAEAIEKGLIDPQTTIFKNLVTGNEYSLRQAIENGDIDVVKGRVFDPKTKTSYNYEAALNRGLLATVLRPVSEKPITKRQDSIELLSQSPVSVVISKPREMSLDEAIKFDIINPETAVIRDFNTFKFVPLRSCIEEGTVDVTKRALVDPKALFFTFDPYVIYVKEPISFDNAVESQSLDLSTGKLTVIPEETDQPPKAMTLKDATTAGHIDPDSALIKDNQKDKLVRLPEAFRKGLMDSDKANVLDTKTSKLCTLQQAYDTGLIVTPKRAFSLLEALRFALYNPTTGCFSDPFQINPDVLSRKRFTLAEAITAGLIDPSSTIVKEPHSAGKFVPLTSAIASGLVDAVAGKIVDSTDEKNCYDLQKAVEKGLLVPAEQRQAVFEKFNLCEENVNELLKWIATIETKISRVGGPKEKIDELRNQINSLKQIKDEIESQSRPVATCLEQIRQIVLTGGDVLSAPEITALENSGRELRSRVDRSIDRTLRLLKRLESARDELSKLQSEMDIFSNWLQTARRELEDKERSLSDLNRLASQSDSIREFVSDVIAHQADLRFITMAAQKFVDESKEFLSVLNEFRTTLPERLPHIEPLSSSESPIRQEVSLVSAQYKDLLNRANALSDKVSGLGGRQREYQDALDKAKDWLRGVQPRVSQLLSDPVAADPQSVHDQLNDTKALHNEFLTQGRLVDNAQQALDSLLRSLSGQLSPSEVSVLEVPVEELKDKYSQLLEALGDRCKLLDTALVQSQGVQDALDSLVGMVNQAEDKYKLQFRPASLIEERLREQIREHRTLLADLQTHQASIDSVASSAHDLMANASNARIAKKVESKLNDVTSKFEKLLEKVVKRSDFLEEVMTLLTKFNSDSTAIEHELCNLQDALNNRELNSLPVDDLARRMLELNRSKDLMRPQFEDCTRLGKDLISMRDVTDTGPVRDRVKALENQWRSLDSTLEEKAKLSKQKSEHQVAYEGLKDQVLSWLSSIEARTNALAPVAVDLDLIKQQTEELRPLVKEHRDYGPTIDKVNDLGAQYDALIRPDSPTRKRSSYSPIKRVSPLRRMSGEARSPSPTKGISPMSPGSSGFGSRRSSQDGFQLSEMSPIQQQLSEINNRYGLVGVRLNDRQNELDSLKDEVKKQQDNIKTLLQFLDKIQRQVPKDSIGNKDEAERNTKQVRKILEDMYEKQSLLDSTKAQIKDLLRRKTDVPGADRLRNDLDNVVDRWKQLNDLCKDRINFSEQLRDFLDTHDNLNNWLNSKERMLTVLGPISSDPRMVQSQVQQVQVLREEFRTQEPQLNHLQEVGHNVLDNLKESSPEGQSVAKKLKDVQNKWDDLVGRLDERASSLGGAADSSKEFDAALGRLREALQNISDNLDALPSDRDHQENLRKIENLERQLEGQRPLLADVEQAAEALCKILGDPASRADVNGRVAALQKQYQALQKKLDNRKAETESALRDGRQFAESCSKTLGWLSGELGNLSERLLVSAHKPTLQHQIDTHEPIYREVMAREHEVIMLINKGKELNSRPGANTDRTVQRDLERIQQQWEKLRREAVDRQTRLQTCMEHCKKYGQTAETFLSWLRTAEDKIIDLKPGQLKKPQIEQRLRELQAFRSEVWKKSGEYENTKGLGDTFLTACDVDKDPIKGELQDMRERWERLNNDLLSRAQELETCSRRLSDFTDELRNLDHAVGRCEDRLGAHDSLGGAAKDPKLLERVKAIREDVNSLKKPLSNLKSLAGDIVAETRAAGGDADHLTSDVDGISDRIDDLQSRLDDRCGELQSAATAVSQFNDQVKNLGLDLNDLEGIIDHLSPPAREIKKVMDQLDEVAKILDKLDKTSDNLNNLERNGEALVDSGFSPDTVQTRDQIATLKKTLGKLDNRTRDHEDALKSALKDLQNFYDNHTNVLEDIKEIGDEVKRMKPVSSELEQIRKQQDDFRRFRERHVEPLAQNVDQVNKAGRDLVRSAQSGVSTAVVEKDLEKLNDRWNELKEKINERDRRLDLALLQSGKFQEALDGLSKWLSDTEEMVANQKPPSSDYKVVKAQLQEQKFLKKMLLDRQNSMSSLYTLGQEVLANCDPSEKASIERQLKELMARFDDLSNSAKKREQDLERAMEVAKKFQDKLTPLNQWLDSTERAIKNMETVPTDEEKIQQRIREHDRLHDEILDKKPDFSELADIAAELMDLVGDDEATALGEKVRTTTERYTNLVEASDNVGMLLADSKQGLRHLVLTYQDLVAWMDTMEKELQKFRVVPVHTEKLLEQMDLLVELNENIANHAPNVESTVEAGSELMKHISNDEALQLKDKLDSLQRRYGELTNKGGDLLKHSQEALPLVQQFHDSHNRLIDWMQGAESTLAAGEPRQNDIMRLEQELADMRPVLDAVNLVGPQLCQISPGEGASTIESLVTRDNRRFDAIVEQIQRKAERLHLSNQRAKEVTGDIDELLEWFRDMDASLRDADPPAMEPKLVRAQLQEHRSINDDISSQKGRVRDVTSSAKKVIRESPQNENTIMLREKLDDLKEVVDTVVQLCSERLGVLEQALPLSEHFADSHIGLITWLDDMENQIAMLSIPAVRPDQITLQQDKNERLLQSIVEHKPLLDKLNKTGEALGAIVAEEDSVRINEILDSDNSRYAALRTELRERQQALENALQESSQFSDKLEGMLRALANTVDQVNQLDPLSAIPQKIREQIDDNSAIADDLDKRSEAFTAVQRAANDVISKAGNKSDPAIRDIKKKLEKLNGLWNDVQKSTKKRGDDLEDTLKVAEKFWKQLNAVMDALKDLEETLSAQEPPAAQPQEIKKQQVALQEIRHEIDQTKPQVEEVRRNGNQLMSLCGEPDKPEVKKHIEDLDNAWDNITALYAKREENLIDAMEKAMEFHETLQNLLKFLTKAEDKFAHLGPVGSDIDAVKKQIEQLKHFKDEVDPHMVEVEALNRQAADLTERTSPEQAASIREPLAAVNRRWENLLRGMVERQKQLEHALLHLGQFQHALNELLVWISKTDNTLDQLKPIPGDPQLLEVELAKLKVLANDIQAHQSSVDTLNDAGRQLIESEKGSIEASTTQDKLRKLNSDWKNLLQKASDRQHELEEALREAQGYIAEVQDILGWLGDVDAVIGASKPVGGLPETATEQLERFMEVYNELEENRPKVETLQSQGQEYIKRQNQMKVPSSNLTHTLRTLKQRWDAVLSRASDKKIKLEIALKEATEFHDTLQAFVEWLTQAEKQLSNAPAVSRVLETVQVQIEDHKVLQKDVSTHREAMLLLDKKGTHLKYFSQKQDVILIKNLLVSVQHRWERVVAKAAERTRALDHGYKEARDFHESWAGLLQWLQETETSLDALAEEAAATKEPQKIKKHLLRLKETQRNLSGKQNQYDATMRTGKNLIERAPKADESTLNKMCVELKEAWSRVCSKSVDRQRRLEEQLLLSGQFSDALQALLDWLKKTKTRLSAEGNVHGDYETVTSLVEQHQHLEQDLQKRAAQMQSVLQTGRDLERNGDNADVSKSLNELQKLWEDVEDLTSKRGSRLEDALRDAEMLNNGVNNLLEWLSQAEHKLRYAQNTPEDEKAARELLEMHTEFMRDLKFKEREKDETMTLAQNIIDKAYPDAIPIIKNWMQIIQQRWDEVSQWAINRESKLHSQLQTLKDLDDTIEELLAWLAGLEATLMNLEREPLPDEIPPLERLIEDHKEFMENTARRQPEVDRACKPKHQSQPTVKDPRKMSRTAKTPIRGSSHDIREQSPDGALRKQSFKGSRDQGLNRRASRVTPSRDTPDRERLPHYGPRFSPSNQAGPELEFRSTRAKLLWDKWRHVWLLAWERQRRLHEHLMYLQDVERVRNFNWDDWRKRFLKYMNHKKSRLTDLFRKMDKDNNGLIPRDVFIDGIINTKFDTSRMEMGAVADLFDRNGEGLIDWQEFIAALRPDWQERKPATDSDKIHDEVKRLVMLCTCRQKFRVFQVGEGKYRFGDSQKLRLVRILRSTVMVRVGGGWVALDEFLVKNDPCRADEHLAELMPIFERLRAQEQLPCAFPLHMGAGGTVFIRSNNSKSVPLSPHAPHCHPSTHWVRERSVRSVAMSRPSRSSLSASTPDSLSDNESSLAGTGLGKYTPRKVSYTRTGLTPGGSRAGSKPNSRPASRQGSKPPSRHGSSMSLDSTDETTPSRIPQRRTPSISATSTPRPSRLSVTSTSSISRTNGATPITRKTASGSASPAPTRNGGMSRATSIPSLTGFGFKPTPRRNISGSSTPSGAQTPRKGSMDPPATPVTRTKSRGTTPSSTTHREPFRL